MHPSFIVDNFWQISRYKSYFKNVRHTFSMLQILGSNPSCFFLAFVSKGKIFLTLGPFFRCYLVGGHPSVILVKLHKTLFLAEHFVITGMTYAWYNAKLGPQIVGTLTSRKVQGVEFIKVLVNNFGIVKSSNWFSFQPKLLLELCHFLQSKLRNYRYDIHMI